MQSVSSSVGETDRFALSVGLHQGSALGPHLFEIVMDVLTDYVKESVPYLIPFADDMVLLTKSIETLEGVQTEVPTQILGSWKVA